MRFQLHGLEVDLERCEVRGPDGIETLTPQEAHILRFLSGRRGQVASREELLAEVWGYANAAPTRAVDNAVYRLRSKIEADPTRPEWLHTVRGMGYRFEPPARPSPGGLHGREAELLRLTELVEAGGQVTVVGPAGIGKTTLAAGWAALEGARVIPLAGVLPGGLPTAVAEALGVPLSPAASPSTAIEQLGRALLARGHRAVVLDEAEELPAEVEALARGWRRLGLRVVVTSQDPLGGPDEALLALGPVDPEAARAIFLGAGGATPVLDRLLQRLDGIPLAIRLAAARVEELGPTAVASLLESPDGRVIQGVLPALSSALGAGLARLPPEQAAVLDAVCLFARDAPLEGIAACTGLPLHRVLAAVDGLRARALIRGQGLETYPIARRLREADVGSELLERWGRWLLANPRREDLPRAAARLEPVDPSLAAALWAALNSPMLLQGPVVPEWIEAGLACAERSEEPAAIARAQVLRGAIRTLQGDSLGARADLEHASVGPEPWATEASIRLGWCALFEGRPQQALEALTEARDRARRQDAPELEAMAEVRLASVAHRLGQPDRAVDALRRAVGLYDAQGASADAARSRANLALMHLELGDTGTARQELERALALDRERGVAAAIPQHLLNLGGVELEAGDRARAAACLREALERARAFGDDETHGLALLSLGSIAALDGAPGEATRLLTEARGHLQRRGNPMAVGIAWAYLAICSPSPEEGAAATDRARACLGPIGEPLMPLCEAACALPDPEPARQALAQPGGPSFLRVARQLLRARLPPG